MDWCVCRMRNSGDYIVMSREERETYMWFCYSAGELIDSVVVKTLPNRNEAMRYAIEIDDVDDLLKSIE